jgi:hypothetical protein
MDQTAAHRWFAIEFNNEAWSIVEAAERSPDDLERLVHLAHAACSHWAAVGTSLNRQRALDLLAHAYAVTGNADQALKYAEMAWQLSERHGNEQTPFDRAEALATMSVALRAAGRLQEANDWRAKTIEAAARLDDDDLAVVERLIGRRNTA